jgi:glycosyltransferase involved in cell wall biosynthesis
VERGFLPLALRGGGYRSPVVAVEHGALLFEKPGLRGMKSRLSRVAGSKVTSAEVAVSDFMLAKMRQGVCARRSVRIYNGIDPEMWDLATPPREDGELIVGCAARLVPGKGIDHLIEAIGRVPQRLSLRLLIAGEGPERPRLEQLASGRRLTERVTFMGEVADMASFWSSCAIAVAPSDSFTESFSVSTLEAMTSGRAVVATRNGAIPELMIDGVTGKLVAAADPAAIAAAILDYADDLDLRLKHGTAARKRAADAFHVGATAKQYLGLLEMENGIQRRSSGRRPVLGPVARR